MSEQTHTPLTQTPNLNHLQYHLEDGTSHAEPSPGYREWNQRRIEENNKPLRLERLQQRLAGEALDQTSAQ